MNTDFAAQEFLLSLAARGRSARTIGAYRQRLSVAIRLPDELERIKPLDVDRLIVGLREKNLAKATLASYTQSLRTFFNWCVKREYLQASPARDLERPRVDMSVISKAIRQSDLEQLIEEARRGENPYELAIVLFLADTGCRAGELVALNLVDLDLARYEATSRGKTGERILDFTEVTAQALRAWLQIRPNIAGQAVFVDLEGRITTDQLYSTMEGIARRCGVKRFGPQSIRHRVGQGWIDAGANLELVRIKLGHKDISTTSKFYSHQDRPRMKAATRRYSLLKKDF